MSTSHPGQRWLQGSVLGADHIRHLRDQGHTPRGWTDQDVVVVLTHSCDVAAEPDAEPYIELIRGVPVEEIDGNLTHGKNPRVLHRVLTVGDSSLAASFRIHERTPVPRELVIHYAAPATLIDDDSRRLMARWAGKRYWREAFPDAFNERLDVSGANLRRIVRGESGAKVSGLYVVIDTDEELPPEHDYHVDIIATMARDDYEDRESRESAQSVVDRFAARMGATEGISLDEVGLKSEAEVSLHDLRFLRRLDYDELSVREERGMIAPDAK